MSSMTLQEFQQYANSYANVLRRKIRYWLIFISLFIGYWAWLFQKPSPASRLPVVGNPLPSATAYFISPSRITAPTATADSLIPAVATRITDTEDQQIIAAAPSATATQKVLSRKIIHTPSPTPLPTLPAGKPTLAPEAWKRMPVIPALSERAITIYRWGLRLGNDPHAFAKIGDGEISGIWFLTDFDLDAQYFDLGKNTDLQPVLRYFAGSFNRQSMAARRGFNTSRVLDPALADSTLCTAGESPLACELRLHRPSFAIVSLGTNQVWETETYARELRQIIEFLTNHGVLPILSTKGDNLEGDGRINAITASLAYEYELPLWNFWLAIQPLPNHGMQADNEHLTYAKNYFDEPYNMQQAWPVRNLTALQVLKEMIDQTRRSVNWEGKFFLDDPQTVDPIPTALPPTRHTPPTLMLHKRSSAFDSVGFLQEFITVLQANKMEVVTYQSISAHPEITEARRGNLFIITIDDISLQAPVDASIEEMITLLLTANYPAVLGVVTEGAGVNASTAARLQQLTAEGWEIAAHTDTHPYLGELEKVSKAEVQSEIHTCLNKIIQAVGVRPITLVLPYGQMVNDIRLVIEEQITWVVGISGGEIFTATDDIYYVGRDSTYGEAQTTFRYMMMRFNPDYDFPKS